MVIELPGIYMSESDMLQVTENSITLTEALILMDTDEELTKVNTKEEVIRVTVIATI